MRKEHTWMPSLARKVLAALQAQEAVKPQQTRIEQLIDAVYAIASSELPQREGSPAESSETPLVEDASESNEIEHMTQLSLEPPRQDTHSQSWKATLGSFISAKVEDPEVLWSAPEPTIAHRYPPDELGEPCSACDSKEKWA